MEGEGGRSDRGAGMGAAKRGRGKGQGLNTDMGIPM